MIKGASIRSTPVLELVYSWKIKLLSTAALLRSRPSATSGSGPKCPAAHRFDEVAACQKAQRAASGYGRAAYHRERQALCSRVGSFA